MNLNDEDKQWIKGELTTMQSHLESRFDAKLEHVETTLLTEFHKWASPLQAHENSRRHPPCGRF
jgi:hypothetical protein